MHESPHPPPQASALLHDDDSTATLAHLVQSNQPLPAGLAAAAMETRPGRLSRAFAHAAEQLRAGKSLGEVLEEQRTRFPPPVRALLIAGVCSTDLAGSLQQVLELERHAADLRRRVAVNLAYPLVLLAMLVLVFLFFTAAVVPQLAEVYDDFEAVVPAQTELWIRLSRTGGWVVVAETLAIATAALLAAYFSKLAAVRHIFNRFPLLGPIGRYSALARFARLLALLIERRVPLALAVRIAADGSRDADVAAAADLAARRIAAGQPLHRSLHGLPQFPPSFQPMLRWGDANALLPDALRIEADMLDGRVEVQVELVHWIVPTFLLLFILATVIAMNTALMMPMVSLINKLL